MEKDVFFVLSRAWDKEKILLLLEMWGFEDHRKGRTDFRGRIKSLRDPRFFKATLAAPYGNKGWSAWPISEHCDPPIAHNQSAKYSDTFAFNLWPDIKNSSAGISIKAAYRRFTTTWKTTYRRLFNLRPGCRVWVSTYGTTTCIIGHYLWKTLLIPLSTAMETSWSATIDSTLTLHRNTSDYTLVYI